MRTTTCDFCQTVLGPTESPATLDTMLRYVDGTSDQQHFDVCSKCAPFLRPSLVQYGMAVIANRTAAEVKP